MKVVRFRLRSLLTAVTISAVLMSGASLLWRVRLRTQYLKIAETYRINEGSCRAALANAWDQKNAAYYAWAAGVFAERERQYRYAAAHPWGPAPPE